MKCIVENCTNGKRFRKPGVSFHRFPKDDFLRSIWISCIGCRNVQLNENTVVCSEHFLSKHFIHVAKKSMLIQKAIPVLNLSIPKISMGDISNINEENSSSSCFEVDNRNQEKQFSTAKRSITSDLTGPTSPQPSLAGISVASSTNGCPSLSPPNSPRSDDSTDGGLLRPPVLMTPDLICVKGISSERGDIDDISLDDFEEHDPLEIPYYIPTSDFNSSCNPEFPAKPTKALHDHLYTPKIVSVTGGIKQTFKRNRSVKLTASKNAGTFQNSTPATSSPVPALALKPQPPGTTDIDSLWSSSILKLSSIAAATSSVPQNVSLVGNPKQQLLSKPGTIPSYVISKKPVAPSPKFATIQSNPPVSIQPAISISQPANNVTSETHIFKQPTIVPQPKPIVQNTPQAENSNAIQGTPVVIGRLTGHTINCKDLPIHPTEVQGCKTFVCEEVELPSHEKVCFINVPLTDDGLRSLLSKASLEQSKAEQELRKVRERLVKKSKKMKSLWQKVRRLEKKCNQLKSMLKEHPRELVEIDEMNIDNIIEEIHE